MRKIYLTTVLSLLFVSLFAQTAQIIDHNDAVINNGDTVSYYSEDINLSEHFLEFKIKNTSSNTVSYKVRQQTINLLGNSSRYFCFAGSCYSPYTTISQSAKTLTPNEVSVLSDFSTHYKPYAYVSGSLVTYPGTSVVAYTVFDENTPADSTYFIIKYTVIDVTSINDNENKSSISNAYPNPASDFFFIDYNISNANMAQIEVMNLLGSTVLSQELSISASKAKIDISNFVSGVYFYNLIVDGSITKSKKLIVK